METNLETTALEIGRWIGQGQAFGLVASKCSAAQARCLQAIRDQRHYESLGLTWEDFCRRHAGISRSYADQIIRNLREFGDAYFRLSEILHISETAFREIAEMVSEDGIEIGGERIPLVPANAERIRKEIAKLRTDLQAARTNRPAGAISNLQTRLDACIKDMNHIARISLDPGEQAALRGLVAYSINKLKLISANEQ